MKPVLLRSLRVYRYDMSKCALDQHHWRMDWWHDVKKKNTTTGNAYKAAECSLEGCFEAVRLDAMLGACPVDFAASLIVAINSEPVARS